MLKELVAITPPFVHVCAKIVLYAPNFEEVEGAYWFGPVCGLVDLSITLAYDQEGLKIGS